MQEKLTLKRVIDVVKLSLLLTWFWPLPKDVNKLKVVCVALYHFLSLILHVGLTLGLVNTIKNNLNNPVIMIKAIIFICATMHVICNIVSYRITSHRLQVIDTNIFNVDVFNYEMSENNVNYYIYFPYIYEVNIIDFQLVTFELENFCKLIKSDEEAICQQYIDKCMIFYGASIIGIYLIDFVIIAGPITLDQPFPTNAEYPFDIYRQPFKSILFIHQSICALQTAAHLCMNSFTALLLWFTSARFELLTKKLHAITNIYDLMKCVQEHQKLLEYAKQVVYAIRPYAFITISLSTCGLIVVGLIFISDQPLSMKIQCIGLACSGLSEVFMYTWPAEHLIHISSEIGEAIYNAKWHGQSLELQRSLQIILMRAQKPTIIMIPCIMPSLSLNYYATYLSTIFSYFTTLRIFIQTDQDVS